MILEKYILDDGTVYIFPKQSVSDRLGEPSSNFDFVMTPAGGHDPWGDGNAEDLPHTLTRICEYVDNDPEVVDDLVDTARALRGTRGDLYVRRANQEIRHLFRVRCIQVDYVRGMRDWRKQLLEFRFRVNRAIWHGHEHRSWLLDDGEFLDMGLYLDDGGYSVTLDASPKTLTVNNGGNRPVFNAVITVVAGGADLTGLTITNTTNAEIELEWTGTLAAGDSLVFDCGSLSLLNNGVDAYDELVLGSAHLIGEWMRLDPGDNVLEFTPTGGSTDSTVTVEFTDQWR